MNLRILHQDDDLIVVDKPAGIHVHPPEDTRHRIPRGRNALWLLRRQTGKYLFPVHRLDRATSGVLLFAFSSGIASSLARDLRGHRMRKTYFAVTRGWLPDEGCIDHPLASETDAGTRKPATTLYRSLARWERPVPVGRYATSRYTLAEVHPVTGRMHQIRRHFAHLSHPLLGDTIYGDGRHNRAFREHLGTPQLMLKAYSLEFTHPGTGERLRLVSRWESTWHRLFDSIGLCPWVAAASALQPEWGRENSHGHVEFQQQEDFQSDP